MLLFLRFTAFPDSVAGIDFYAVTYWPATNGPQFAVLNVHDQDVTITITYPRTARPNITEYTLSPGQTLQIQVIKLIIIV